MRCLHQSKQLQFMRANTIPSRIYNTQSIQITTITFLVLVAITMERFLPVHHLQPYYDLLSLRQYDQVQIFIVQQPIKLDNLEYWQLGPLVLLELCHIN